MKCTYLLKMATITITPNTLNSMGAAAARLAVTLVDDRPPVGRVIVVPIFRGQLPVRPTRVGTTAGPGGRHRMLMR
jgi:hypothetical protein